MITAIILERGRFPKTEVRSDCTKEEQGVWGGVYSSKVEQGAFNSLVGSSNLPTPNTVVFAFQVVI